MKNYIDSFQQVIIHFEELADHFSNFARLGGGCKIKSAAACSNILVIILVINRTGLFAVKYKEATR